MEFLDKVNLFISGKNYANKGIRTKDGKLAYVTSTGVTKEFASLEDAGTAGPNCPNEFIDVDQSWQNLGFPVGSLMVNGQSCGNEGKYVRSAPPSTDFDWKFYLQNNGDLPAAGLTTEQQANQHWNDFGKSEGRAPNATIFSSMGALGRVGYIDVDTVFHPVEANYSNNYKTFPNHTNLTGTEMKDCSEKPPFLKYGEPVIFMQNGQTGYLNSGSVLQFGGEKTNLFFQPPASDPNRSGRIIKSGDTVCISSSSSSYTTDCGWWGCKVGKINEQKQFIFGAGGEKPQEYIIFSIVVPQGNQLRVDYPFILISIPQSNKANLPVNKSVNCTNSPEGRAPGHIYRYSGANELEYYPTGEVASTWNSDWGVNIANINCETYNFGDNLNKKYLSVLNKKNAANLKFGDSAGCNSGRGLPKGVNGGIYRYVDENILRWYPNPPIARSWAGRGWWRRIKMIDCTSYKAGPPMGRENDGIGKELIEPYRIGFVANGVMLFGSFGEVNFTTAAFSLQIPKQNSACDIGKLKNICNGTSDCIGFVQAPSSNSWQMINSQSSSANYKITSAMQDIYVKDAAVDLLDDSCEPGPVSFIKGSVLAKYPLGDAIVQGKGKNNCKVIHVPKGKVSDGVKNAQRLVNSFPNIQNNPSPRIQMKAKTDEYIGVIDEIKKMQPSITLEQQYKDMTVFDEQNRAALIIWAVLSVSIVGFVYFRMKS